MKRRTRILREREQARALRRFELLGYDLTGLGPKGLGVDLGGILDDYLFARYRHMLTTEPVKRSKRPRTREENLFLAERFMLIEHGVDRAALEAALRLGGVQALFVALWDEDDRIGPRGPEAS